MAERNIRTVLAWFRREMASGNLNKRRDHPQKGDKPMTHHETEEAVNQGRCSLLLTLDEARAAVTLYGPDGAVVSAAVCPAEGGAGLREAYRTLFNDVEARYSQKLCRLSALWVTPWPDGVLPPEAVDESGRLTEAGVLLLDPVRNLRPGVPVSAPPETGTETVESVETVSDAETVQSTETLSDAETVQCAETVQNADRGRTTGFDAVMAKYRAGELTETPDGKA